MKAIVSIGCYHFATTVNSGAQLIELLGKAEAVEWALKDTYRSAVDRERGRVEMKLVRDEQIVSTKDRKRIPAKAGPDCHRPMVEQG